MADFEPGTRVVVKDMPTLLGVGKVVPTPPFSQKRWTWAKFKGGTECAFEPGDLQLFGEWVRHHHPTFSLPDIDVPDRAHFAGSANCGPDCCEAR